MRLLPTAMLLVSLCGSCQVAPADRDRAAVPEDGLLVDASPAERSRVSQARVAHGKARDDLAASKRQHELALFEQATAKQQHGAAVDEVSWAKSTLDKSKTTGTKTDIETAQVALQTAENARGIQDVRCELRNREVIEAEMQTALATAHVNLATAQVDLAKVVAVNTLDRPLTQKPDVERFEAMVREAEGLENVARAGLAAASREVEIGRSRLSDREQTR